MEQAAASELKQKILATVQALKEGLLEREMEVSKLPVHATAKSISACKHCFIHSMNICNY